MIDRVKTVHKEGLGALAQAVLEAAKQQAGKSAVVLALHGDLGAGKTTFVQTLGALLGVQESINSPTFTIMKAYQTTDPTFTTLLHMDAYRIDSLSELPPLRFDELRAAPQTLFCIEWAEKIAAVLPQEALHLTLNVVSETVRTAHLLRHK